MAECSECGKKSMSFECKYCGEKYCSEHRLPENHECDKLEEGIQKEKEEADNQKWFREKDVRDELKPQQPQKTDRLDGRGWLLKEAFKSLKNNATLSIISFTVFFYILQVSIGGSDLTSSFNSLFVLYPEISKVISQPWTLITVMFLHGSAFHLFANMITLYFFGRPVENLVSVGGFLKFYFGAGIIASLGFVAARNLMLSYQGPSVLGPAVGASGAVVACFAAVAMLYPDAEVLLYFFIPMKIKTALYGFGGVEVLNLLAKFGGVQLPIIGGFASSAHLAGIVVGIWYGRKLRDRRRSKTSVLDLLGA